MCSVVAFPKQELFYHRNSIEQPLCTDCKTQITSAGNTGQREKRSNCINLYSERSHSTSGDEKRRGLHFLFIIERKISANKQLRFHMIVRQPVAQRAVNEFLCWERTFSWCLCRRDGFTNTTSAILLRSRGYVHRTFQMLQLKPPYVRVAQTACLHFRQACQDVTH